MSEPTPEAFVTPAELAEWMNAPQLAADDKLTEALAAALEWTADKVGPLEAVARAYTVWPSGRSLVLTDSHLTSVSSVVDPDGTTVDVPASRVNLLAGVIEVNQRGRLKDGPWTVTATTREHGDAVKLAVKIIASHLYEVHRGRAGNPTVQAAMAAVTPVGDPDDAPRGFAIPARAAQLLKPFLRPRGL